MAGDERQAVTGWDVGAAALVLLGALLACSNATDEQLRTRSAFDFNCPESQLTIVELDPATRGVTGCGRRATYVSSCDAPPDHAARTCKWVLNSESKDDSAGERAKISEPDSRSSVDGSWPAPSSPPPAPATSTPAPAPTTPPAAAGF